MTENLTAALDAIDDRTLANPDMLLMRAKARGLMHGYDARWYVANKFEVISVEETLTADLYNPSTEAKSRSFTVAGVLDVRASRDGRATLIDHKTTGDDITDPSGPYWKQLVVESQPSHYMLLEWLNGRKPDDAVWDVVRKPGISPRNLTKADEKELSFQQKYLGVEVPEFVRDEAIHAGRETFSLYEIRLALDCTANRPEWYFQRRTVPRLDHEIIEYATELWDHSQDILAARRSKRMPRNSGACMQWGSACKFLGVCSGHDDFDSDKWTKTEWPHPELPVIGGDVLTNSRIRLWQTCRRKHKFQFDDRIERVDAEDKEALIFGTLWHHAQAAWWAAFIKKEEDNGNSTSASANSVEHAAQLSV